jgi:hypothetical protein
MKALQIISVSAMFCVVGCAHHEENHYTPPSSAEVHRNVARVAPYVRPEGKEAYADLQKSITDYQIKVEKQTSLLAKAEEDAIYWHEKQIKALRELWLWRGIAIFSVVCVVGYIGIKTSWKFLV